MQNLEEQIYKATNIKLTPGQRVDYAVAEFGYNAIFYWISAFMMVYMTDVAGINAAAVGTMLLLIRLWDALMDPIIGSVADRTKSRFGRYKPWVFTGAFAMSLFVVLTFSINQNWDPTFKVGYMVVVYIGVVMSSTCCNMPFGALNTVLTSDSHERIKLSGMRMVFANIGGAVCSIVAVPLILFFGKGQMSSQGYFWAVLVTCIIGLPTLIWTSVRVKEVVLPPPDQIKIPIKKQFSALGKNGPMWVIIIGMFFLGFMAYGRMAMLIYYFIYNCNDPVLATTYGFINAIGGVIGAGILCPWLYKVTNHKGKNAAIFMFITAAAYVLMYWTQAPSFMFWLLNGIACISLGGYSGTQYGMIPDGCDYGEYISGVSVAGFLSSFTSTMMKAGGAVGPAVGAMVLAMLNYVPNQTQTPQVLSALNWSISLAPGILCLICGLIYLTYKISGEKHEEIRKELERRRMTLSGDE